ncbi:MAG: cobalt-precorrin-5B (C(1))-methyltransferase, partial [Thermoleophilia bacterium]
MAEGGRRGLSTGTCAAAAAKAAALALLGETCTVVTIELPAGEQVTLAVESVERLSDRRARAAVIKDAGDDPDVTDGLTVVAEVEQWPDGIAGRPVSNISDEESSPAIGMAGAGGAEVELAAGPGVGTVTRAGLQIAVGEPAINPVPRQMIATAVRAVLPAGHLRVTVSIP